MSPGLDIIGSDAADDIEQQNTVESLSERSSRHVKLWRENIRGGFAPFPVAFDSAEGHIITDVDGKQYIDMISQFAVMNFGHSHPKIVDAVVKQMQKLPLVNTSYINPLYAEFADKLTKVHGSEAVESAVKIARKWGYVRKGIPSNEAWILTADRCYHGITLATMSLSNNVAPSFGAHIPNVGPFAPDTGKLIKYGKTDVLEEAFVESGHKIAAFIAEPIQGLAGTRVPPKGYLKAAQDLCHKHNVLFICDEIQSGYGRTGTDLAYQHEPDVLPDLVTLGKAITGGMYPMSVVMGKKHVMDVLDKYEVAGTFAASPVGCAAAIAALEVLEEEQIAVRSKRLGELLTKAIDEANLPYVVEHRGRGRGLFQTLVIDESVPGVSARRIAALCALRGMLCGNGADRLRFSPPLVISETDLIKAVNILSDAMRDVAALGDFPGSDFIN